MANDQYTVQINTGIGATQILRSTVGPDARYTLISTIVKQHVREDTGEILRTEVDGEVTITHEELMADPAIAATFGTLQQTILLRYNNGK